MGPSGLPGTRVSPRRLPGTPVGPRGRPSTPMGPRGLPGTIVSPRGLPGTPVDPSGPQRPPQYPSGPRAVPGQAVAPVGAWSSPAAHRRGDSTGPSPWYQLWPWSRCGHWAGRTPLPMGPGGSPNHPLGSFVSAVTLRPVGPAPGAAGRRAACPLSQAGLRGRAARWGDATQAAPRRSAPVALSARTLDSAVACSSAQPRAGLPGAGQEQRGQELPPGTANARRTRRRQSPAPALSAGHVRSCSNI